MMMKMTVYGNMHKRLLGNWLIKIWQKDISRCSWTYSFQILLILPDVQEKRNLSQFYLFMSYTHIHTKSTPTLARLERIVLAKLYF
jgi:hypothetical protein